MFVFGIVVGLYRPIKKKCSHRLSIFAYRFKMFICVYTTYLFTPIILIQIYPIPPQSIPRTYESPAEAENTRLFLALEAPLQGMDTN